METAIVPDMLHLGHAPARVFVPFEKGGAPAVSPSHANTLNQNLHQRKEEDQIHIEQLVNYQNEPVSEQQNGFKLLSQD